MSRRPLPALSAVAVVGALLLAGCSSTPEEEPTAEETSETVVSVECAAPGSASDAVSVAEGFGVEPVVEIPTPLTASTTEVTTLVEGVGAVAELNSTVTMHYTTFNGTSGEEIYSTGFGAGNVPQEQLVSADVIQGLRNSLGCATEGDRLVVVIPAAEAWGDAGNESLGLAADDSIVFVIDVLVVEEPAPAPLERVDGVDQEPVAGFPTVSLADDGRPTVTIPDAEPPTELSVAVLKQGSGAVTSETDTLVLHYQGVNWSTGEVFDQSWGGDVAEFPLSSLIEGFRLGASGQTVGSQIIVVIPPELGYGPRGGNAQAGISETDTIVFVIDILGIR